jgi:hypothetical protein
MIATRSTVAISDGGRRASARDVCHTAAGPASERILRTGDRVPTARVPRQRDRARRSLRRTHPARVRSVLPRSPAPGAANASAYGKPMVATGTACTSEGGAQPAGARRASPRVQHRCLSTRDRVLVCVADGSEVVLGAPPSTGIAKPAAVLGGRGVAVPGHLACADHGRQAIIVCRIRPCIAETSLAESWDGVLAADSPSAPSVRGSCGRQPSFFGAQPASSLRILYRTQP